MEGLPGPEARALCAGDLNGNGRPEVLAATTEGSRGAGLGFYWIARGAGIVEEGDDPDAPWTPLLLVTDRVENPAGLRGWSDAMTGGAVGPRYTMSDAGRICLQIRRLGRHAGEEPLLLMRWDPSVARYEPGPCASGTAGPPLR